MSDATYFTQAQLLAGLPSILQSPKDGGTVALIVCRPRSNERRLLSEVEISPDEGLRGDKWAATTSHRLDDGGPDPRLQLALINVRCLRLIAGGEDRMSLAGDNLVVDLDLSFDNLPAGQRLLLGEAEIEITDYPHLGCSKFRDRYGPDAKSFVNSDRGKRLRLRGVYARVIHGGVARRGDAIRKLALPRHGVGTAETQPR
jgi:MOSC domain-containing protein YiiM